MISQIPYNIAVRTGYGEETVEDSHIEFIATQRAADGEHDSGHGSGGRKEATWETRLVQGSGSGGPPTCTGRVCCFW